MRVSCPVAAFAAATALVSLALPSAALADATTPCREPISAERPSSIETRFNQLDPSQAVHDVLADAQDAGVELDPGATWSAGVSPGPLTPDAARAAIEQRIRAVFGADDADFLVATMRIVPQPYAKAHLQNVQMQLLQRFFGAGLQAFSLNTTCRITVVLGAPNGEPERVKAAEIAAPYGDAVIVTLTTKPGPTPIGPDGNPAKPDTGGQASTASGTTAPTLAPTRSTVSLWKVVRIPVTRRCVRGTTISVKPREGVTRLQAGIGSRQTSASGGKALRLRLPGAETQVALRATTADGRIATRTLTYRRCSARR